MVFDLVVEPSALELPSLNPGDTAAIALMKFSGIPVNVVPRAQMNPKIAPVDTRVLLTEGVVDDAGMSRMCGFGEVYDALTDRRAGADVKLSRIQRAEARAFCSMVSGKLGLACVLEAWGMEENYYSKMASTYASTLPIALKPFLPKMRRSYARKLLPAGRTEEDILLDAEETIAALEARLGNRSKFFYGTDPSAIDAVTFGYVAFTLMAPCPRLQAALANAPNLVRHTKEVAETYFEPLDDVLPDLEAAAEARKSKLEAEEEAAQKAKGDPSVSLADLQRKRWNRYFLGTALASFIGYVLIYSEDIIDFDET